MTIALDRPQKTKSAQIWEKLGYPIVDTDVHTQEFPPAFLDYLEQVAGTAMPRLGYAYAERFQEHLPGASRSKWFKQSCDERLLPMLTQWQNTKSLLKKTSATSSQSIP